MSTLIEQGKELRARRIGLGSVLIEFEDRFGFDYRRLARIERGLCKRPNGDIEGLHMALDDYAERLARR